MLNKQKGTGMGHRIIQRIYECARCGETPSDGENMWHMGRETWCEKCCDKDEE